MMDEGPSIESPGEVTSPPRIALWLAGLTTVVLFILLNAFKIQDVIARAAGYAGPTPMFKLDMTLNYTPDYCYGILSSYGEVGRKIYAVLLSTLDALFPLLYGTFFFLLIRTVYRKLGVSRMLTSAVSALPLLATLFDWSENIAFIRLMSLYPSRSDGLARIANVLTLSKFGFFLAGVVGLLIGAAGFAFKRRLVEKRQGSRQSSASLT